MGITMTATGAFRETGASFFFIPKGALTHHPHCGRWYPSLRSGRALCEADCALCGERQTMPQRISVVIVCSVGRQLSPCSHLCCKPLSSFRTTCHPPAKTCHRQLCRSCRANQKGSPGFLFCERETEKGKRNEVRTIGNLSFGGEGHQPRHRALGLRGLGLYELLRHL